MTLVYGLFGYPQVLESCADTLVEEMTYPDLDMNISVMTLRQDTQAAVTLDSHFIIVLVHWNKLSESHWEKSIEIFTSFNWRTLRSRTYLGRQIQNCAICKQFLQSKSVLSVSSEFSKMSIGAKTAPNFESFPQIFLFLPLFCFFCLSLERCYKIRYSPLKIHFFHSLSNFKKLQIDQFSSLERYFSIQAVYNFFHTQSSRISRNLYPYHEWKDGFLFSRAFADETNFLF